MAIEGLKQELLEDRARALSGIESFGIISAQTRGNAAEVGLEESQPTDYLRLKFKSNFAGVKFHDLWASSSVMKQEQYHTHRAPIAVPIQDLHGDSVAEDQPGRELLGSLPKRLPLFRAVNAVQPDTLALAVVQHGDGVAVADAHHAASEVGGEGG